MKRIPVFLLCLALTVHCNNELEENKTTKYQTNASITTKTISLPSVSVIKSGEFGFREEMGFVRNEIFARHGRAFQTDKYRDFFSQFDWYNLNPVYHDSLLSDDDLRDISILQKYESTYSNLKDNEIKFLKKAVGLIKQRRYGRIDTSFTTIGQLNNDSRPDTVFTHIFEHSDSIHVKYKWNANGKRMWEHEFTDPYLWISDSDLFQYDTRDIWIVFTIATQNCVFELIEFDAHYRSNIEGTASMGMLYFKASGIAISKDDYMKYLQQFNGQLVVYQQDEFGGLFDIWYEPLRRFVPFYRP